ncbi:hypothetical protein G6706_09055 [Polynucleobacter paneuropaeus]|nr:hypothetical protein [Polynucleobacter paneuropaeus]MBT8541009.1 hypothetical protein [Polynucleobacter paneuropaeus]MBT8555578.1 hypothetical protein [Polynucleobacter paneuropaeus]MBT8560854.1 hypothetical protein [Polynucleobacter paneuropaeus]
MKISKKNNLVFYGSNVNYILRCLLFAVLPQIIGSYAFIKYPEFDAIKAFLCYIFGVLSGIIIFKYIFRFKYNNLIILKMKNNKIYYFIAILLFIPIIPDTFYALFLALQGGAENIRYVLLNNPDIRIINIKLLTIFSVLITSIIWLYFTFLDVRNFKITFLMLCMLFLISCIWASRSDLMLFIIFYFLNRKKVLTKDNILLIFIGFIIISFYTIFIQGRSELVDYINSTVFYSIYFAYPIYLFSHIPDIFTNISIFYSAIGYPADIVETALSSSLGFTSHLSEIAEFSNIGEDIFGSIHSQANVLYPQYGFLYNTIGNAGVYAYYLILTFLLLLLSSNFQKYMYSWRFLIFILIWDSSRSFPLAIVNTWIFLISTILISNFFISNDNE